MASSTALSDRLPLSPPYSAILGSAFLSNTSPAAARTTLPSTIQKGVKRRASDELLVSAAPNSHGKRAKTVRSSSQPPVALRNSMSRMRDSATPELDEDGLPVRYTPTTGRISKAKKGLPVHYCQYGCGKVYTRAEHRKRHEANHRKDALFKCTIPDCEKEFQRIDLFQRHLEKQWVPEPQVQAIPQVSTNSLRHGQGTGISDRTRASSVTSSIGSSDPNKIAEQIAIPNMATQMGLGLTTPPYSSTFPAYTGMETQAGQMGWSGPQQMSGLPSSSSEAFSDAYSPSLRQANTQVLELDQRSNRTMSAPPTGMQAEFGGAMPQIPETPGSGAWPSDTYWQQQPMSAATSGFEDAYRAVEHGRSTSSHGLELASGDADFSSAAPILPSSTGLVELDAEHLRHYHECYWTHFDLLFPIVHRGSYSPASAESGLLGAMILAVGAQFSPRSSAPAHSVNSFNIARSIIEEQVDLSATANLDPQSLNAVLVAQLQGVFLWEYFAVYRSQQPGVHKSKHFAALYNLLLKADLKLEDGNIDLLRSTNDGGADPQLTWLPLESLRRLLLACFVLDTHRTNFFHQPSTCPLPHSVNLPRPCTHELWTTDLASPDAWQTILTSGRSSPTPTPFKVNLNHALSLNLSGAISLGSAAFSADLPAVSLTAWSLHLTSQAPVRALLVVASEGSYAASPVPEAHWTAAKTELRKWVGSPAAPTHVHAAGRVLTMYFARDPEDELHGVGLELDWCLYIAALVVWAYTSATDGAQGPGAGIPSAFSGNALFGGNGKQPLSPTGMGLGYPSPSTTTSPRSVPAATPPTSASARELGFLPSQPLSSPASHPTLSLQQVLLALGDADRLGALKGRGGSGPVLWAVRSVVAEGAVNLRKGLLLAEAEAVLAALGDVEEGRRGAGLLGF